MRDVSTANVEVMSSAEGDGSRGDQSTGSRVCRGRSDERMGRERVGVGGWEDLRKSKDEQPQQRVGR